MIDSLTLTLLIELIDDWAKDGDLTPLSAATAKALLSDLAPDIDAPRIAPDSEGYLVMHWEDAQVMVLADDMAFHLVEGVGTQDAQYQEDIQFDGAAIPPAVIAALTSVRLDKRPPS